MEVIISANETFDLASGSHFLVNTTEVSGIYFGVRGRQQAGVTFLSRTYPVVAILFLLPEILIALFYFSVRTSYMNSLSLIYVRKRYNSYRCFQFRSQSEVFKTFFFFWELILVENYRCVV